MLSATTLYRLDLSINPFPSSPFEVGFEFNSIFSIFIKLKQQVKLRHGFIWIPRRFSTITYLELPYVLQKHRREMEVGVVLKVIQALIEVHASAISLPPYNTKRAEKSVG